MSRTYTGTVPDTLERDHDWRGRAACRDHDPELFFPLSEEDERAALSICGECPVRQECLDWAIAVPEPWGVWGGTTETQRRHLRTAGPPTCQQCGASTHTRCGPRAVTRQEIERIRAMAADGCSDPVIGRAIGRPSITVATVRHRHGIPAGVPARGLRARTGRARKWRTQCGTDAGIQVHRDQHERMCTACLEALAAQKTEPAHA